MSTQAYATTMNLHDDVLQAYAIIDKAGTLDETAEAAVTGDLEYSPTWSVVHNLRDTNLNRYEPICDVSLLPDTSDSLRLQRQKLRL